MCNVHAFRMQSASAFCLHFLRIFVCISQCSFFFIFDFSFWKSCFITFHPTFRSINDIVHTKKHDDDDVNSLHSEVSSMPQKATFSQCCHAAIFKLGPLDEKKYIIFQTLKITDGSTHVKRIQEESNNLAKGSALHFFCNF